MPLPYSEWTTTPPVGPPHPTGWLIIRRDGSSRLAAIEMQQLSFQVGQNERNVGWRNPADSPRLVQAQRADAR